MRYRAMTMVDLDSANCARCGRASPQDSPAEQLAWVMQRENGRQDWLCGSCGRAHVRDIEGKLPTEYW